jgi:hypothetical protein
VPAHDKSKTPPERRRAPRGAAAKKMLVGLDADDLERLKRIRQRMAVDPTLGIPSAVGAIRYALKVADAAVDGAATTAAPARPRRRTG